MVSINPFNGRKDLLITFCGENDKVMAMFRVIAIDFKGADQISFLEKYMDFKPYDNFTSFEAEIESTFKGLGALNCQSINANIELMEGSIKHCKIDIIKDW